MLAPVRLVAPAAAVVTPEEAKAHLRVDSHDDDPVIATYIAAATDQVERSLDLALIEQTWRQRFSRFGANMRLAREPLISIEAIEYFGPTNAAATLASSVYSHSTDALGPYVALAPGASWPSTYSRADAVTVTWKAGFGPAAKDVPAALRQSILLIVGDLYANREATLAGPMPDNAAVERLLGPFRRHAV